MIEHFNPFDFDLSHLFHGISFGEDVDVASNPPTDDGTLEGFFVYPGDYDGFQQHIEQALRALEQAGSPLTDHINHLDMNYLELVGKLERGVNDQGLPLTPDERDALQTRIYGTQQAIAAALNQAGVKVVLG